MDKILMLNFKSPSDFMLTFADDGKVAYAYLKKDDKMVADVWLYNRCQTPKTPEWTDGSKIPFANCKGYMSEEGRMTREVEEEDVLVDWENDKNGPVAYVYLFENLYGVLGVGDKPGYARYAIKNSPLAKVMDIE